MRLSGPLNAGSDGMSMTKRNARRRAASDYGGATRAGVAVRNSAKVARVNWPAIVEEARQRRKGQKLTQQRLAELAGVSTPTISRSENGAKDIQLSSVTSILGVLGMIDDRALICATRIL
jgi:DNA-binding XRE family transcriptional regulator